jgi:hypothetical protein
MSLAPPDTVRKLQEALHAKAKRAPTYRFYALYDKVHRADVLSHAYRCCAANGGAAGVDGQTFADIEAYGVERWLGELTEELRSKRLTRPLPRHHPQALCRESINRSVFRHSAWRGRAASALSRNCLHERASHPSR